MLLWSRWASLSLVAFASVYGCGGNSHSPPQHFECAPAMLDAEALLCSVDEVCVFDRNREGFPDAYSCAPDAGCDDATAYCPDSADAGGFLCRTDEVPLVEKPDSTVMATFAFCPLE